MPLGHLTTIVGKIEARNSKIITESLELLDFQIRRLLEESFKETENQVRILVADLAEGMWAQQRRVIGILQRIQQYGPKDMGPALVEDQKERRERENGRIVPSLDERASS
jgi:hypothetical protein